MPRITFFLLAVAGGLEWRQLPDAPWSARSDTCGGVVNGTIVIAGGHANNNYTNDVWLSDDAGASWRLAVASAPWPARSYHSCVVLPGEQLLLVGGHAGNEWFNDVWVANLSSGFKSWTRVAEQAPFAARAAGSLQYQAATGKLFYMAGSNGLLPPVGKGTLFNDVWVSSDQGATWKLVNATHPWPAREGFTGQSSGGDIVVSGLALAVMGGERSYLPTGFFSDIWTSEDGATWTLRKKRAEWAGLSGGSIWNLKGRSGHIVASQSHQDGSQTFWLSGGYLGRNDVWCLDGVRGAVDLSRMWKRVDKSSPWHGRFDHMMTVVGNQLVLFGGENSAAGIGGPYYNDVWAAELEACAAHEESMFV